VGSVYLRIYNSNPTFALEDPKRFTVDLLDFIKCKQLDLVSVSMFPTDSTQQGELALTSLAHVIRNNAGVEMQTIGHFKMLFSLLESQFPNVQEMALSVISCTTANSDVVSDIAATNCLGRLLVGLRSMQQSARVTILETIYGLNSNTKLVKEAFEKGAVIYLLDVFCNSGVPGYREKSAEVLSKMVMDKLVGPKVRICVTRFLPTIFLDAMKQSPEAAVSMLDSEHENPELIWNEDTRKKVARVVGEECGKLYQSQKQNPDTQWSVPENFQLSLEDVSGEIVVSGVYLRLFVANPGWVLRKPKQFMEDLLENMLSLMSGKDSQTLTLVTDSLVRLLEVQPALLDQLPATGYLNRVLSTMNSLGETGQKSPILLLHASTKSAVCVDSLANCDCVAPLHRAMRLRKDMLVVTCETFNRMFNYNHDSLVSQAINSGLVKDLLNILGSRLENIPNASACKAQVVNALKSMQRSLVYGDQVSSLLQASSTWAQYESQKHDLFIEDKPVAGYLTSQPQTAGYLTMSRSAMPSVPPPIEANESSDNQDLLM